MSFPYALELVDVVKRFGDHTAVDNVSFTVETGTIMALLGPNGAGKTTTIEMCEGFQRPDSGKISVLGMNPAAEPDKVRAQVGIMLQDSGSYSGIRVREMLELTASYSRDPLKPEWLLELFGLQNVQRTTYRRLSGGQKQRLNLAVALISRPRLVFVDEPTAGMDAQSRLLVWDLLRALRSDGVTVILTTHLMDEAQALADQVTIVDRGRVVAQGTPAELQAATATTIHFETDGDVDLSRGEWQKLGVSATKPRTYVLHTTPRPEVVAKLAQLAQVFGARGVHAAFALNRFKKHGHHIRMAVSGFFQRLNVIERHADEAGQQRLEALLHFRVGRGAERGDAAAMKGFFAHHDLRIGNAFVVAVFARQLEGGLVGFQPAVAEKDVGHARKRGQLRRQPLGIGHVVVIAAVNELAHLLLQGGHQLRMGVAQRVHGNAGQRIQIAVAVHVPQAAACAALHGHRQAGVGVHGVRRGRFGRGRHGNDSLQKKDARPLAARPGA